jgi:Domain of unknown function (DUF4062)
MARVYVSSTFSDLQECREQVRLTLRRMDHEDMAMEYYTAEESRPLDKCLRDVDVCDLYVCLVAWRYGFIPEGYEHSITELEYRRAVEANKPCLVFLLDENADWSMARVETAALVKVEAFRRQLQHNQMISFFTGPDDIGARVTEAVYKWGRRQGIATGGTRTDWEAYRAAVFDKHRWIRLTVIAGAKHDRSLAQIPLTKVFVAQRTTAGRPTYDVPDDLLDAQAAPPTELPELLSTEPPIVLQEPSLEVLGREPKQVVLGGPGTGKSTLFHFANADAVRSGTVRSHGSRRVAPRAAPVLGRAPAVHVAEGQGLHRLSCRAGPRVLRRRRRSRRPARGVAAARPSAGPVRRPG